MDNDLDKTNIAENAQQNDSHKNVEPENFNKTIQKSKHCSALRILMWTIIGIVGFCLLVPVLIYIPPIQTALKNVACSVASQSTGMKIEIERFRLKFPIDIALDGVNVIEASGDTMVHAREAIADVKLRPLLDLDIQLNSLKLNDGLYRMVSADSSMILKAQIGKLIVEGNSGMNLNNNHIDISKAELTGGHIQLYMDVWKAKNTPPDPNSAKFIIKATDLKLKNIRFSMSMLPTIDTLDLTLKNGNLKNGIIDLNKNKITANYLDLSGGNITYLTPTPEYIESHPAPIDTTATNSLPMTISADSISLSNFAAIYAMKGAKPQPGFDANYVSIKNLNTKITDFYNRATELRIPIKSLTATERCGLELTETSGIFAIDSLGLTLNDFKLKTSNSSLAANIYATFGIMAMQKDSPMKIDAEGSIGMNDVIMFMPSLKPIINTLRLHRDINFLLTANGTISHINVDMFNLNISDFISLIAKGNISNPTQLDKIKGNIDLNGNVRNPSLINQFIANSGFSIPALRIVGNASIDKDTYSADMKLLTSEGNVLLNGLLCMSSQGYDIDLNIDKLNVAAFMPSLGIGYLSADITAEGNGFNPANPRTWLNADINLSELQYNNYDFEAIEASAHLNDGAFDVNLLSFDPILNIDLNSAGLIIDGNYRFNINANINNIDLFNLGFSKDINSGNGIIKIDGDITPKQNLYNVNLAVDNFDWNLPGQYIHLPHGLAANFIANNDRTEFNLSSVKLNAFFNSPNNLETIVDKFVTSSDSIMSMINRQRLDVSQLNRILPEFNIGLNASGQGLLKQFLATADTKIDSIAFGLSNKDKIDGFANVSRLNVSGFKLDTINLKFNERGRMLDYRLHIGNKRGTLDDFAQVNLNGYMGDNRASLSINQKDIKGKTGYRLGLTAAIMDSTVNIHLTPLNATIAYMPWKLNDDNYIEYGLSNNQIFAELLATSNDSRIEMHSKPDNDGNNTLDMTLRNIHIADFLKMSVLAPPITGTINSDMNIVYKGTAVTGKGNLNVTDFCYDRSRLGSFDFKFDADLGFDGNTNARLALLSDNKPIIEGYGIINNDSYSDKPADIGLKLTEFPLQLLNPFLGKDVAGLEGFVEGDLKMSGTLNKPLLNGKIACEKGSVYLPIMGSSLKLGSSPITVENNYLQLNKFTIYGANDNPLTLDGHIDARNLNDIGLDISMDSRNMQVINNDRRARSDIYGKLFVNFNATAKGKLKHFDVNANVSILPATDIFYTIPDVETVVNQQTTDEVVKFVNFTDTTTDIEADTTAVSMMNMRVTAQLNITNGAKATINLSNNGRDRVELSPSGRLTYTQNYMGDMRLNGQLNLGSGYARYNIPLMGEKKFDLENNSYVLWNGDLMNPILHINAIDRLKANVKQDGQNSRLVNFDIALSVTNNLNNPKIIFDLSTEDDATVQNELKSMSADQRSNQAINMLLYNAYTGPSTKASANLSGNPLYSFLESQINSWAANNIRGVDLSFGISQYDKSVNGQNSTAMSYSYQVSKSLFDNRFKIVVGGNYSTDASADENFAQNLISDISFEYTLKQTNNLNMLVKLFRHTGFESILEGEISEMGVGFVMKRRLSNLAQLFRFRFNRKKKDTADQNIDTIKQIPQQESIPMDSLDGFDYIPIQEGYDVKE